MNEHPENLYQESLKVFGKVTAGLTHEIKNALAIMNENAGLLEDFTYMADKGKPIDSERLKLLAGSLSRQIERIDALIKNMNRFSHSMDEWIKEIDLNDILSLMVTLTGRLASMKRVTLTPELPASPVMITTHTMFLEALLFVCIHQSVGYAVSGKDLPIRVAKTNEGAEIQFGELHGLSAETANAFIQNEANCFLSVLKADVNAYAAGKEIIIRLPNKIE